LQNFPGHAPDPPRTPLGNFLRTSLTRIENAHKVRIETFDVLLCIDVQQTFRFRFSLLRHSQMAECFYVNNCCFWARATVLSWYRNW